MILSKIASHNVRFSRMANRSMIMLHSGKQPLAMLHAGKRPTVILPMAMRPIIKESTFIQSMVTRNASHASGTDFQDDFDDGYDDDVNKVDNLVYVFFYLMVPLLITSIVNNFYLTYEKLANYKRKEFIPYEFNNIRKVLFPWGDGNHTLFYNPRVNPLPEGWEFPEDQIPKPLFLRMVDYLFGDD